MNSKHIRSFDNVNDCVKEMTQKGHKIRSIVMAFSQEHTIVIGKLSISLIELKKMKKKQRLEHLQTIYPGFFHEKLWIDRFEKEFAKWNAK